MSTRSYPTELVDCPQCHGMGEVEDDLWVWTRCYSCFGQGEIEVCAYCLYSGDECEACDPPPVNQEALLSREGERRYESWLESLKDHGP